MRTLAWDTETALIRPGRLAPPLTCVSYCTADGPGILHWSKAYPVVRDWLLDPGLLLVGHNVAFDMAVLAAEWPDLMPLIFDAYEADRVTDTMLRQQLLDIVGGCYRGQEGDGEVWIRYGYGLGDISRRNLGRVLDKDTWRLRYGEFRDVDVPYWPEGAALYPMEDARATYDNFWVQEKDQEFIPTQYHEARAAFAQHLQSAWGLRTSPEGVRQLREATEAELARIQGRLIEAGLVRPNGARNTKAAAERMLEVMGEHCARTPGGKPKLDGFHCKQSEDPLLIAYGEYTTMNKVLSTDVKMLESGLVVPIHTTYGLAESGRATSFKPNIQNLRRLPGVREAFVPRPGMVFADADYPSLELWALSQVQKDLFGSSALGEVLKSGRDAHTALAAQILGISYEEAALRKKNPDDAEFDRARGSSGAKGANFGFPGGLGPEKFVNFVVASGGTLPVAEDHELDTKVRRIKLPDGTVQETRKYIPGLHAATVLREQWMTRWTEMGPFFKHIDELTANPEGLATVTLRTGMVRGGAPYCAAANTYFQGLGAAATKCSAWELAKACYVQQHSVLFGSRPVATIHDQFIVETPECETMHEAAYEVAHLMQVGAEKVMPDYVPNPIEPVLSRYWSKKAKAVFDDRGRMIPWPK